MAHSRALMSSLAVQVDALTVRLGVCSVIVPCIVGWTVSFLLSPAATENRLAHSENQTKTVFPQHFPPFQLPVIVCSCAIFSFRKKLQTSNLKSSSWQSSWLLTSNLRQQFSDFITLTFDRCVSEDVTDPRTASLLSVRHIPFVWLFCCHPMLLARNFIGLVMPLHLIFVLSQTFLLVVILPAAFCQLC